MKESLIDVIQFFKINQEEIRKKFNIYSIGLFGSVINYDFNDESDIDIIVLFNISIKDKNKKDAKKLNKYLKPLFKRKIVVYNFSSVKPNMTYKIKEDALWVI